MSFDVHFQGFSDLLVRGAEAADWVVLPVGCPVGLTRAEQFEDLPDQLRSDVALVRSGAELRHLIESA